MKYIILIITTSFIFNISVRADVNDTLIYNRCILDKKVTENKEIKDKKEELNNFIKENNYNLSIKYEDIITGFSYEYTSNKIYYGASLIKLVDALYLIENAIKGQIDLSKETIKYTKNYIKSSSEGLKTKKLTENISLKDLIYYAIKYSDNSAHFMLIDYIGLDNLKKYGQSLGGKVILSSKDKYSYQTAEDTNKYLLKAYNIIKQDSYYGTFLKNIMNNNKYNSLNFKNVKVLHKYGLYANNYHDIGLNIKDSHPYTISILTLHLNDNYKEIIQKIHSKIIEIHTHYWNDRNYTCYKTIS